MKLKTDLPNLVNKVINIAFWLCIIFVLWIVTQIVVLASFRIPSNSMEPELTMGDYILVLKPTIGSRIFNVFASLRNEQTEIHRIPGFSKIKRNDILVFNYPHPNSLDKIEMHILKYHIKRCIGLPGDILSIQNGFFHVEGIQTPLGNIDSQKQIATTANLEEGILRSFPSDSIIDWTIKDFGPLYIPRQGNYITLDRANFQLYKKLIEWEQQGSLQYKDTTAFLNGKPIKVYRFQKNYYFMSGDKGMDSHDSRYWGLLPEEYIVGKAWIVWKSINPFTGKFRKERFLKVIH